MCLISLNRKKLMNSNFAKLCAIAIVGGVAKALFRPAAIHNHYPAPEVEIKKEDS